MKQQMKLQAAILMGLALPASAAFGQMVGVSHPDEVPVTTSDQGVRQPMVYVPTPAPRTALAPMSTTTVVQQPAEPTFRLVGSTADVVRPMGSRYDADAHIVGDGSAPAALAYRSEPTHSSDIDAGIVTRVDGPANGMPVGTLVRTRLLGGLSTRGTVEGTEWQAELTEPLMRDGRVLVPAGAVLRGKVSEIHGGRRISGEASIRLQPISVTMPDGTSLGMHAQVIDTNINKTTKVNNEGTILRRDHKKEDIGILALSTGSGAAAGALIAGVPGALVGAGVGAGVSTVIWLKQDRQAEIPRGTQVTFELNRPLVVGVD